MLTRFQKKCIQYILVHASFSLNFRLNQQSSLWPAQQTELNTQPFPGTTNHFNHPWCRCQGSIKYIDDPSTWRSSHRTTTTSTSDGTLPNLCWRWDVDFWLWFREFDKIFKLRKNKVGNWEMMICRGFGQVQILLSFRRVLLYSASWSSGTPRWSLEWNPHRKTQRPFKKLKCSNTPKFRKGMVSLGQAKLGGGFNPV